MSKKIIMNTIQKTIMLNNALSGFSTNTLVVMNIMKKIKDKAEFNAIRQSFEQNYSTNLMICLKKELTEQEFSDIKSYIDTL